MDSTQASSSYGFKKIKLTIIPPKQLFADLTNDDDNLTTPSPTITSSSPTPLNTPSKTPSTNDNILDVPPRPSNPQPLQSHPSLDITLSLSPITPLDHILDTPSPPSPQPPPQPPLMGHPIYFNYHDYHGSTCFCCFHNCNIIFSLRDEMNLMFAHIEFLLTFTMNSLSPPHP
ncbi:hypothetical protein Tco_1329860 [Tanacetum coccineum]